MDSYVPYIVVFIALILFGLAVVIVFERGRAGWRRAEQEKLGLQRRQQELTMRIQQLQLAISEQKRDGNALERQIGDLKQEVTTVQAQLDAKQLPFLYTAVPLESADMYAQSWRFVVRHGNLGADLPETEPAGQWAAGRLYIVAAQNQTEARSVLDRLFPRHRGFTITTLGSGAAADGA